MAGGKRARGKKQYAEPTHAGGRADKVKQDNRRDKQGTRAKEPVERGDRTPEPRKESCSDVSRAFPKRKRARVLSPSTKLHSPASKSANRQQEDAEASFPHDHVKEYDQFSTEFSNSDTRHPFVPSLGERSQLAVFPANKASKEYPSNSEDGKISRDNTALPDVATSSSPPASHGHNEASLVKDPDSPHPDLWIWFGRLQCVKTPAVSFPLRMRNDGSECRSIMFGYDQGCDIIVSGPGIGPYHCLLNLELSIPDEGPLRRRVVVKKIHTVISPRSLRTTVWGGEEALVVEDKVVLPSGGIIQFGNGEQYLYYGPEVSSLYLQGSYIYGSKNSNSSVRRVERLSDKRRFIAKIIPHSKIRMAIKEITVYEILGHHPRIVRFMETFYDFESGIHHIILEAGSMDLYRYTLKMRSSDQDMLQMNAPQWVEQITSGTKYIHEHGIAHRDIKPQNVLVFVAPSGSLTMKVVDMGLARHNEGPVVEPWLAGTEYWYAPGPFMAYKDDRLVDCYGIGRVLFFLLTPYPWPSESQEPKRACGCPKECKRQCTRRRAALQVVKKMEAGNDCLDFLENLLVGHPEACMNTSEMHQHPYLAYSTVSYEV